MAPIVYGCEPASTIRRLRAGPIRCPLVGLEQVGHEKSKKGQHPTSALKPPRSTRPDEHFSGTAAPDATRGIPSGIPQEILARCETSPSRHRVGSCCFLLFSCPTWFQ